MRTTLEPQQDRSTTAEVLSGAAGAEGVRRLVLDPAAVPASEPGALRLVRTKFKPGRLVACYRGTNRPTPPAAVTWRLTGDEVAVEVRWFPDDPAMPHLRRLVEARHHPMPTGTAPIGLTVLRYRPGQRHVLALCTDPEQPHAYLKLDRDDSGALAVPVARSLRTVLADDLARPVPPLGFRRHHHAALWSAVPGDTLTTHLTAGSPDSAVLTLGRTLRALHRLTAPALDHPAWWAELPSGDAATELAQARRAGEHLRALDPTLGRRYDALLDQVAVRLGASTPSAPVLVHGDCKADNVLVSGSLLHLLDWDRVRLAEPATDLGKLRADLGWWGGRAADGLAAALREGYDADPATWTRAAAYEVLYLARAAARRVPVHLPDWAEQVTRRLAAAEDRARAGGDR